MSETTGPDPGSTEAWLRHAESDLRPAKSRPDKVILELLCFHAQQAAEKALKGLLVHQAQEVPRTHNIGQLIDLLEYFYSIPEAVIEAARLTLYSVETRYPAFGSPVSESEYLKAIEIAEAVIDWVKKHIA